MSFNFNIIIYQHVIIFFFFFYRDWRGVADLFSLGGELIPAIANEPDPVAFILNVATQKNPQLVIKDLQVILEKLERWDVFDDTQPVFGKLFNLIFCIKYLC